MAKYVLLYSGGSGMAASEAEREAIMKAWGGWYGRLGSAVVDGGNPFSPQAKTIAANGTVSDAAAPATGYTILAADSLAGAVELAKGCPVLQAGGSVTVSETFDVM